MARSISVLLLLALEACAGVPQSRSEPSPCSVSEASYECQIERYQNISTP